MARSIFPSRYLPWLVVLPLSLAFANFVSLPLAVAAPAEVAPAAPATPAAAPKVAAPQNPDIQIVVAQGTVRDPDGKPVKGANVSILNLTEIGEPLPQVSALTDAEGHFVVEAQLSVTFMNAMRGALGMGDKESRAIALIHAPGFAVLQKILSAGSERGPNLPTNDLTLARGWSATGQVVDKDGKPVASAIVQAKSLQLEGVAPNSIDSFIWLQGMPKDSPIMRDFQVGSDATGHFTLHDLPLGTLTIALDDPRFVQQTADIKVKAAPTDADKATLLTARLAAKLRGRVIYPDGKPVAGVVVTARSTATPARGISNTATTKPDGTYELGSMDTGKTVLTVAPPSPDWSVTMSPEIQIKGDEETRAADLTLSKGILLTGYVREDGTKQPVAGVSVTASNNNGASSSATTDAQGRYQIRVQAGDTRFYINTTPTDFAQGFQSSPQISVGNQSRVAPDFLLQHSLTLAGTAKDEKGQPATGAVIGLTNNYGAPVTATVDAQGNWTLRGISPQRFGNEPVRTKVSIGGEWALRGNANVTLPSPPLSLTLYRITLQDVKLRVLTPQGQPIADAQVQYRLSTNAENNGWNLKTTTSNAQGEVTLPKLRPDQTATLTATKQGYILTQSGKVSRFGGVDGKANPMDGKANPEAANALLHGSDIVMAPLDAKVTGHVVDAQGQPAAGARVALLFPNDLRDLPDSSVRTDDKGQFTLTGLPQGEVTIGVAKGRAFGQATLQANGVAELKLGAEVPLVAPQNTEAAFAQLEQWTQADVANEQNAYDFSALAAKLVTYDAERALRTMTDANGKVNQSFLTAALPRLAQSDPQRALEWSKKLLPLIDKAEIRSEAKLRLAVLTATADPAGARQIYDLTATATAPTDFSPEAALSYAKLAALAGALKDPDAEGWLQALSMCLAAIPDDRQDNYVSHVTNLLAEGDLAGARRWAAQLNPKTQVQVLGGLVTWAVKHDIAAAQQMLGEMETLIKRADFPVEPVQNDGRYRPSATDTLNTARTAVVSALMATNMTAAQEMAKRVPEGYTSTISLQTQMLVRQAGDNDKDAVQTALDAARDGWESPAGNMAFIAALISDSLPQLSTKAFQDARDKLAKHTDNGRGDGGESASFYAYARAPFDPAESRLLLENDWLHTMDAMRKAKAGGAEGEASTWELTSRLINISRAMIPLDIARTTVMMQEGAKANGDFSYYIGQARRQTINWLLADAKTRRNKPLGNGYEQQDDD